MTNEEIVGAVKRLKELWPDMDFEQRVRCAKTVEPLFGSFYGAVLAMSGSVYPAGDTESPGGES